MYRFIHYLKTCQEIKSKQKEFGFVVKSDFEKGLKKTIEWHYKNPIE